MKGNSKAVGRPEHLQGQKVPKESVPESYLSSPDYHISEDWPDSQQNPWFFSGIITVALKWFTGSSCRVFSKVQRRRGRKDSWNFGLLIVAPDWFWEPKAPSAKGFLESRWEEGRVGCQGEALSPDPLVQPRLPSLLHRLSGLWQGRSMMCCPSSTSRATLTSFPGPSSPLLFWLIFWTLAVITGGKICSYFSNKQHRKREDWRKLSLEVPPLSF